MVSGRDKSSILALALKKKEETLIRVEQNATQQSVVLFINLDFWGLSRKCLDKSAADVN